MPGGAEGVHVWGACVPGEACVLGGCACLPVNHTPWHDTMKYGWSMSRQYTSYWNEFL